ncbi:MAG: hypothetical protein QM762_01820 [Chryseolinea sp.]
MLNQVTIVLSNLPCNHYIHRVVGKDQTKDLLKFLKPFSDEKKAAVLWLRDFVWDLYPQCNELIYDNYNALAFGWSPTEKVGHTFCSIAIGRTSKNIHFGFYWGSEIKDPKKMLIGEGNQYRYILVEDVRLFPAEYMEKLLKDAYANSMDKVKDVKLIRNGLTITKSVSEKKRTVKKKVKKKDSVKRRRSQKGRTSQK